MTITPIEAVLCSDLYSKQIKNEVNYAEFSNTFDNKTESDPVWICPNLNSNLILSNIRTLAAEVIYCNNETTNDLYANRMDCSSEKFEGSFNVRVNTISTYFDQNIYS